jgi:mannose-1-phosphate guanylyltransferase/mannose-6-phosphate isomerase
MKIQEEVQKLVPIILCGGTGNRLWPKSREKHPKQFHKLVGEESLLIKTLKRTLECSNCTPSDIITITTEIIKEETEHQLKTFNSDAIKHFISEPSPKNTAAAIAYSALYAEKHFGHKTALWIVPADHYIEDHQTLKDTVKRAEKLAQEGYIVTFGMAPTNPSTDYGYIKVGNDIAGHDFIQAIEEFIEKPNGEKAKEYIQAGNYVWNSGMFVATVETLINNFKEHCHTLIEPMEKAFRSDSKTMTKLYNTLPALAFDIAIMEKTQKSAVIPCDLGWNDMGNWNSVYDIKPKDENGNIAEGKVTTVNTKNCLIQSESLRIATLGLENLIIIENQDSILIADRNSMDSMKELVDVLRETKAVESLLPPEENRPWGSFKILSDSAGYKMKELTVKPEGALSTQMHQHRSGFWTVISGSATVIIDGKKQILKPQESVFIPQKTKHSLQNETKEPLVIVEIQSGEYLGEDDIVRF